MAVIPAAQLGASRFVSFDPDEGVLAAAAPDGTAQNLLVAHPDTGDVTHLTCAPGGAHVFQDAAGNEIAALDAGAMAAAGEVLAQGTLNVREWDNLLHRPQAFPPSAHTHTFGEVTGKPTTLAGYGITDGAALAAGLPPGGTAGQVLARSGSADYSARWIDPAASGSGGGFTVLQASVSTGVGINPRPVVDTVVPGLTVSVPAHTAERTVLVSAYVSTSVPVGLLNNVRIGVDLDGTRVFPAASVGEGQRPMLFPGPFETPSTGGALTLAAVPVTVPGDGAAHTISIMFNAVGTTAAFDFQYRHLTVAVPGGASASGNAGAPTAHAATHSAAGTDPLTLAMSQVSGLDAVIASKEPALGLPPADGYVLTSTAAGLRLWAPVSGGSGSSAGGGISGGGPWVARVDGVTPGANGWVVQGGTWADAAGVVSQSAPGAVSSMLWLNRTPANGALVYSIEWEHRLDAIPAEGSYLDTAMMLSYGNGPDHADGVFVGFQRQSGGLWQLAMSRTNIGGVSAATIAAPVAGQWYRFRLTRVNSQLALYLDDALALVASWPVNLADRTQPVLRSHNVTVSFRGVKVHTLATPAEHPEEPYTRTEADARFAPIGGATQAGTVTRTTSGRVVSDTFSRADGPVGPAYEVLGDPAAWRVSGGRLRVTSDPAGLLVVAARPTLVETVQVVRVRRVGQGGISLFAQYDVAGGSGYELALQSDGNIVLYRQSAGPASRVVLWSPYGGFNEQTTYEFKLHTGPGFQTVYRDGVAMATTTDTVYAARAGEAALGAFSTTGYAEVMQWTACRGDEVSVMGLTGQQSARVGGESLRAGGGAAWPQTRLEVFGDDGALLRQYAGLVFGGDVFSAA